jgi:serine/threonine-protein kinase
MELVANARIGDKYEIVRKVGAGAFAEVWLGRDVTTGAQVALKRLLKSQSSDPDVAARFKREAYFLSRVRSDNVARISELVVDPTFGMVLVMEFIEGHLLSFLMQKTLLGVEEAIDLGQDILCGVRDLHMARIIHRDLKPSNVILRPVGEQFRAVIFDFSLSRLQGSPSSSRSDEASEWQDITNAGTTLGTLEYMAPEQIISSRDVTDRSDLYAVGSILYTAVAGEHPFAEHDDNKRALARAKLYQDAPPLATGRSDELARTFEAILAKALARMPHERYSTAQGMLEALERLRTLPGDWGDSFEGAGGRKRPGGSGPRGSTQTRAVRRASSDTYEAVRVPLTRRSVPRTVSGARPALASTPSSSDPPPSSEAPPSSAPLSPSTFSSAPPSAPMPSVPPPAAQEPARGPSLGWLVLVLVVLAAIGALLLARR